MNDFGQMIKIPTTIMRGGTSKGLILRKYDLPSNPDQRDKLILRMFGSPDSSQIDGLGGGTSLTSKLAIVGPPSRPGAHIDYTFGQVSVENHVIDYRVTCGNLVTAVGLYAAEEGFVPLTEPVTAVHIYNTNIDKIIVAEIPVANGQIIYDGDFSIDGVPGVSSKIMLNFLNSGGTFTGNTLPTGNVKDTVQIDDGRRFEVSIVDCANTIVIVRAEDVGAKGTELQQEVNQNTELLNTLEKIRVQGGILAGLIKPGEVVKPSTHALPKIIMVTAATDYVTLTNREIKQGEVDIISRYMTMGALHKAHAVSGAMALATACKIPGTLPFEIAPPRSSVRIGHPSGTMYVETKVEYEDLVWNVVRAACGRTARRLMDGYSYVPASVLGA
ncbi:2-methylaconitate cis-trans-isomerase PrpF [Paenibacillus sp. V4I9]|uniref:2-methylaconitate cis-trans isomerase PrpF family protein n=1 Tax=Paenibacillus sp. V4I9 TaxID=3042308 RepID=UPI00278B3854|nr:PrpF domain-containing protein [Paenibacillus sp. V4I9]MDQ0887967.1 2-methylaconitate cis-trans-isomerase PrpF [Paenibacillus sp. V4I9]